MSIEKYNQMISNSFEVEATYSDQKIETYHRLAYICCVNNTDDIEDIDKIFNFINENYSFFSQLTKNKQLSDWIYQHVFQLANSTAEIDYPDSLTIDDYNKMIVKDFYSENIDYDLLPNVLDLIPQYIKPIVDDLNMNVMSDKCMSNIHDLRKLAKRFAMKDLYEACTDLEVYCLHFNDMDEIIRLFQIVDIQAYQVLQFIERLKK